MSLRQIVSSSCAALALLAPLGASAQSISIQLKNTLVRRAADGNQITKDPNYQPYGINLDDCRSNQSVEFSLVLGGYAAGDIIEVWATDAGGDCSQPTHRTGGTQVCYKLGVGVPLTPNPIVRIPVQHLIAGRDASQLDADGCRRLRAKTSVDVQFLFFRGGTTGAAITKDNAPINVKTLGPAPLSGVRVLPGDTRLSVSWDAIGEGGVDDVVGVRAYCDLAPTPSPGSGATIKTVCEDGGTDEAGDPLDGGCRNETTGGTASGTIPSKEVLGASGAQGLSCSNATFASPDGGRIVPDATFDEYKCGSVNGITGNTIMASDVGGAPLPNDRILAVAVAGTDSFNNVGELSDPICQYPEATTDFWKGYRGSGGRAGGCDATGAGGSAASASVLGVAALFGASLLRRRRDKRKDR